MTQAVVAGSIAVAALNALAGLLGSWLWYDGAPGERSAGAFWMLLRAAQGAALVLALAVGSLAAAGNYSTDHLFYLYALLPLAVGFIAEQPGGRVDRRDRDRAGHDGVGHGRVRGAARPPDKRPFAGDFEA
ncbi:MAG TPA: hypothetical protein VGH21_01825, partial [Solirubrobacteraceae bacterium]